MHEGWILKVTDLKTSILKQRFMNFNSKDISDLMRVEAFLDRNCFVKLIYNTRKIG